MEIMSLKSSPRLFGFATPGPPISRRGTRDALRAGFRVLKQPTFYTYEMTVPVRRRLHVKESKWAEPTVQVWPHNVFLCKYLEMKAEREGPKYFTGKRVLELGAGCGLTGMVAAMLGASVTVVERTALYPHLRHNVVAFTAEWKEEAQIECEEESAVLSKLELQAQQVKGSPFDVIMCSDISGAQELRYSFLLTLLKFMQGNAEVLMCHTRSCWHGSAAVELERSHGGFISRLAEIFEVEEVESEDTIRAFCEQLTGGTQLLRSQSAIDIQESSDAEGRLVILRLTCARDVTELKNYVHEQLEKEAALQHEKDRSNPQVPGTPAPSEETTPHGTKPPLPEKSILPQQSRMCGPPSTAGCLPNEIVSFFCKNEHASAAAVRRSSQKRTLSGMQESRESDIAARSMRSRILRPRIAANTKREPLPVFTGGVHVTCSSGCSSVGSIQPASPDERFPTEGKVHRIASAVGLSPSRTQQAVTQPRNLAARGRVSHLPKAEQASPGQDAISSPTARKPSGKCQAAISVNDKLCKAVGLIPSSRSSSRIGRPLLPNFEISSAQGRPFSCLRSQILSGAFKDKGATSALVKQKRLESENSPQAKASCPPMSTEAKQEQPHASTFTMAAKALSAADRAAASSSCTPTGARPLPSLESPVHRRLPDASRLGSCRGRSAAPKAAVAHVLASIQSTKGPARPFSTMDPTNSLTTEREELKSTKTHENSHHPVVPCAAIVGNTTVGRDLRSQQSPQPSKEAAVGTFGSSRLLARPRNGLSSAQQPVPSSSAAGATRKLTPTTQQVGGTPTAKQDRGKQALQQRQCGDRAGSVGRCASTG